MSQSIRGMVEVISRVIMGLHRDIMALRKDIMGRHRDITAHLSCNRDIMVRLKDMADQPNSHKFMVDLKDMRVQVRGIKVVVQINPLGFHK
jgi:hypothetical protein